jgi:hypothetical protein
MMEADRYVKTAELEVDGEGASSSFQAGTPRSRGNASMSPPR